MHNHTTSQSTASNCEVPMRLSTRVKLSHTAFRPTHVDTEAAAQMLLVDPKTLHKSHSLNGSYGPIRPVRLPSRKLAWPLAEIEKVLNGNFSSVTAGEGA